MVGHVSAVLLDVNSYLLITSHSSYHPELVELRRILGEKTADQKKIARCMRDKIVETMLSLAGRFNEASIQRRVKLLSSGAEAGFTTRIEIINSILSCCEDANKLVRKGRQATQDDIKTVVVQHSSILGKLIPLDDKAKMVPFAKQIESISTIASTMKPLLKLPDFCRETAELAIKSIRDSEAALNQASGRISQSLQAKARVHMCTIGSSHKLPTRTDEDNESDDLVEQLERLSIDEQKTIAIFDEAGCIPSYELVGLSRLGRCINGIVAVGDKHQLPPYDPGQSFGTKRKTTNRMAGRYLRRGIDSFELSSPKIKSILDASKCSVDEETKIKLTTQYRVPRDIAGVLNARIYKGDYRTPQECRVPDKGLVFIDVPKVSRGLGGREDKRYVNHDEIDICLQLIRQIQREYDFSASIMFLTPVGIDGAQ